MKLLWIISFKIYAKRWIQKINEDIYVRINIPYITAKQYICLKQMKQFEYENNIKYKHVVLNTYNDIVENGYNISML